MSTDLLSTIGKYSNELAIGTEQTSIKYSELRDAVQRWQELLNKARIPAGAIVSIEGEYGTESIGALVACLINQNVIMPLSSDSAAKYRKFLELGQIEYRIDCNEEAPDISATGRKAYNPLYTELRRRQHPGLVLFTSGSTGESKGAVHDLVPILEKFEVPRQRLRTVVFLQLDHIGGINTLFYTLFNGGSVLIPPERSPRAVCKLIEKHRAELLPTSPTFLNLLLISGEIERADLSSLRLITYGTEPMPNSTLQRLRALFPGVRLQQTYGSTEFGILRSKSRSDGSLWVRIGGEGYETKVFENQLWVRAKSAMLGYLNAPNPFDDAGFMDTGDEVEVDGDWIKIVGRKNEIINVGGSKVYPAEVESVLLEMDQIIDVSVRGEPSALTGQIVAASIRLAQEEPLKELKVRLRRHCKDKLPTFAIPVKIRTTTEALHSARFKRMR